MSDDFWHRLFDDGSSFLFSRSEWNRFWHTSLSLPKCQSLAWTRFLLDLLVESPSWLFTESSLFIHTDFSSGFEKELVLCI